MAEKKSKAAGGAKRKSKAAPEQAAEGAAAAAPQTVRIPAAEPKAPATPERMPEKAIRVTQIRAAAGRYAYQRATLKGLGLDRIRRTRVLEDTVAVRGMIERVKHLVRVEPAG